MIVTKAYKFKLKTNAREKIFFAQSAGCVRLVWNKCLALQKANCDYVNDLFAKQGGKAMPDKDAKQLKKDLYKRYFPTGYDLVTNVLVPIWKKSEELNFLNNCPAQALQKPIAELDKTLFKAFTKKCGFPRFKKKENRDSIHFPQGFKVKGNKLFLPKLGWIKFFKSREIIGGIKNITVTSDSRGNWFASICTEQELAIPPRKEGEVGIDVGVTNFATLSNGELIKKPQSIKVLMLAKKRFAKALSRKKKGGNNRKKAVKALAKIDQKITNIRKDFHHKLSSVLSKNHALIVVENLKVANMSKSAKGTIEAPGRNVKAKSGLNREILANGWYNFRQILEYKQYYSGGKLVAVNPINTSRMCSECGSIDGDSRVRQEWYACKHCGHALHADINAAINILAAGQVVIACGDIARR